MLAFGFLFAHDVGDPRGRHETKGDEDEQGRREGVDVVGQLVLVARLCREQKGKNEKPTRKSCRNMCTLVKGVRCVSVAQARSI